MIGAAQMKNMNAIVVILLLLMGFTPCFENSRIPTQIVVFG